MLTKVRGVITDWTLVNQATVVKSGELDVSTHYKTTFYVQGFIDTTDATAHTGTEFVVQSSSVASPNNEDWADEVRFIELIGTMNPEPNMVVADPAPIGTTVILVASTAGYVVGDVPLPWIVIQDLTLVNSELAVMIAMVANTSITILDGTTNAHAKNTTLLGNIAFSRRIEFDTIDKSRLRLVINNNYDSNGAKIDYKLSYTGTTKV